jgi:hypothetical protein
MSNLDRAGRTAADIQAPLLPGEGVWRFQVISGKVKPGKYVEKGGPEKEYLYTLRVVEPQVSSTAVVFDTGLEVERPLEEKDLTNLDRAYHRIPIFDTRNYWDAKKFHKMVLRMPADIVDSDELDIDDTVEHSKGYEFLAYVDHEWLEGKDFPQVKVSMFAPVKE